MTRIPRIPLAAAAVFILGGCGADSNLEDFEARASYAIGMDVGKSVKATEAEIDLPALIRGLSDVLNERELGLTDEEATQVLQEFSVRAQDAQREARVNLGETNVSEGEAFRAENGARDGVETTASGLQYEVLREGDGERPAGARPCRLG